MGQKLFGSLNADIGEVLPRWDSHFGGKHTDKMAFAHPKAFALFLHAIQSGIILANGGDCRRNQGGQSRGRGVCL